MKKIFSLCVLLSFAGITHSQDFSQYQKKIFIRGSDTLPYRILYPKNYKKGKSWPLIVFLHGSGERGRDNEAQLIHGGNLFLRDSLRNKFPAIVIFPQCPDGERWNSQPVPKDTTKAFLLSLNNGSLTVPERLVKGLMDSLTEAGMADKKRIYLGGLSLGGIGTYDLAINFPHFFAAIFPICGYANGERFIEKARAQPIWAFHGALDNSNSPQPDRDLYKALMSHGAKNAHYTEYPLAHHNSWDSAFAEPNLLPWLFSNHK